MCFGSSIRERRNARASSGFKTVAVSTWSSHITDAIGTIPRRRITLPRNIPELRGDVLRRREILSITGYNSDHHETISITA